MIALNERLKNDIAYNPTMTKAHELIIEGKYKVTGSTIYIQIAVEHKEDEI